MSSTVFEQLLDSRNIVHVAALFYLLAFLFRDQLILRGLILLGNLVYVLYFYFAPETPLWGGIFWSSMFTIVNLAMVWLIFFDEVQFSLPADERKLFDLLQDLTPGQFRKLMKAGKRGVAAAPLVITRENEPQHQLYFVTDGRLTIEKAGQRAVSEARTFIGEIAFLLSQPATATVTLEPGCHYCVWDSETLHALLDGSPALRTAVSAAMNRKLAQKVAQSGVLTDIRAGDPAKPGKKAAVVKSSARRHTKPVRKAGQSRPKNNPAG